MAHISLDGRYLRANEKFCGITGYTREDLLRRTFKYITHPATWTKIWNISTACSPVRSTVT